MSIPEDVFITLIRAKTVREEDLIGEQVYVLADGSRVKSVKFRIRYLQVGGRVLENVTGSVGSRNSSLLLGQSFLGRFKSWSMILRTGVRGVRAKVVELASKQKVMTPAIPTSPSLPAACVEWFSRTVCYDILYQWM